MKRSIGVTVIAVLALLGSSVTLLMGIFMAVVMYRVPQAASSQFPGSPTLLRAMLLAMAVVMYVGPAIWGIWASVGLFRLKNWARLSIIAFASLLILMSVFGGLMFLVIPFPPSPSQRLDPAIISTMRIFMATFATLLAGLGVWWVVFFNRAKVRMQFVPALPVPVDGAQPQGSYSSPPPRPDERPLSFTILAWLLLVSCLFIPLNFWLHTPAMFMTKVLSGWPATVFYLAMGGLLLYIGIGLLRMMPRARVVAIWYFVFAFANAAVFYLAPGGRARMSTLLERQQAMFPWMPRQPDVSLVLFNSTPFVVLCTVGGLIGILVPIYFLVTRKEAFERAAAAAKPRTSVAPFAANPGGTI